MEILMTVILWFIIAEGYYRLRVWWDNRSLRHKWTCPKCHKFSASASDGYIIDVVMQNHSCEE